MTKEAFRTQYKALGYTVQPVAEWRLVHTIDGIEKYDVNYIAPGEIGSRTAYVLVTQATSDLFRFVVPSEPVTAAITFTDRLRTYIRSLESATVFAAAVKEIFELDAAATVYGYTIAAGVTTQKIYIVKERAGAFSFKELS